LFLVTGKKSTNIVVNIEVLLLSEYLWQYFYNIITNIAIHLLHNIECGIARHFGPHNCNVK